MFSSWAIQTKIGGWICSMGIVADPCLTITRQRGQPWKILGSKTINIL